MKVIFSHGKESGPWGSKIKVLANIAMAQGFDVDSIDYSSIACPDTRVDMLNDYVSHTVGNYVLVGSSMGGYVSLVNSQIHTPKGLFLLAPALYMLGYKHQSYTSKAPYISIVHGWSDDVIPVSHSIRYAQEQQCDLHLVAGDHRLNSSLESVTELFNAFLKKLSLAESACSE